MAYREPGVYLEVQNNPRGGIVPGTLMLPLIIGTGSMKLKKTISVVRGLGQEDILPFTTVSSILRIGKSRVGAADWLKTTDAAEPQDYDFVAPNSLKWEEGKGPIAGSVYYVTLVHAAEESQFEIKYITSIGEVISLYGPDIQENEDGAPICPVSLGAQLALQQGTQAVYVLQVPATASTVTLADYQDALDKYAKFMSGIWRITPMDVIPGMNAVVMGHVNLMSSVEERMERCSFLSRPYSSTDVPPIEFPGVLTKIGGFAQGIENKRATVIYPDFADVVVSDGTTRTLPSPYLLAALSGLQAALPTARSLTRASINGFKLLRGVRMTRTEKNALAATGVMLLDQASENAPIVVRHQLSTDMASTQSRENSILSVQDYCAKFLRTACEPYIGKYNINSELISMLRSTLTVSFATLQKSGIINTGRIDTIEQDSENPDTIIISLSVLPPYPCNYIEITLVLE